MAKKEEKLQAEIHLKQIDGTGFSLKTSGTAKDLGEAIISLQAWFISEYIDPKQRAEYLIYIIEALNRKAKENTIKSIEIDIENLLKQMGGKE